MSQKRGILISLGRGDEKRIVADSGPSIKIQGKPVGEKGGRAVDLVIVLDTTGSMSDKIEGLLATCARFVDGFAALGLDHRVAIVAFGDLTVPGDKIEATSFMKQLQAIKDALQQVPRYGGGGNEGESSLEALEKALALPFRANAVKAIILITDEPALQHQIRADDMINQLSNREFLTFVVSPPLAYFQEMARRNGGKWYRVAANTDFTDLLAMFKQMAEKVSQLVSEVHRLGQGSVASYLRLKPPEE